MYNQNDSIGLAESPGSLGLDDEPASLTEAEFTGVETDVCRLRDRLGREAVRVEVEVQREAEVAAEESLEGANPVQEGQEALIRRETPETEVLPTATALAPVAA